MFKVGQRVQIFHPQFSDVMTGTVSEILPETQLYEYAVRPDNPQWAMLPCFEIELREIPEGKT